MAREERTLPDPRTEGPMSLEAALAERRSVRSIGPLEISLEEIRQRMYLVPVGHRGERQRL